ncbi:MAG: RecX family transcriptional regulator [Bacteroidaceae bacterium]|nr:RecX family transcriptional regulator [Bacteroidaceae bacterium]
MKALSPKEAYARATARCARQEQCRADVAAYLAKYGLESEAVQRLLDQLEDEGYIDEARYAAAFTHDKVHYDRWGRMKIRQALALKGIAHAAIDAALADIDKVQYETGLRTLLEQKRRTLKETDAFLLQQKLARFAAGRGFEAELIFRLLE